MREPTREAPRTRDAAYITILVYKVIVGRHDSQHREVHTMPRVRYPLARVMSDDDARGIAFLVLDPYTVLLPVEITTVESASLVEVRGRFTLPSGDTDEIMMAPPARPIVADDTIGRIIAVVRRVAGREIKVNGEFVTDYA